MSGDRKRCVRTYERDRPRFDSRADPEIQTIIGRADRGTIVAGLVLQGKIQREEVSRNIERRRRVGRSPSRSCSRKRRRIDRLGAGMIVQGCPVSPILLN